MVSLAVFSHGQDGSEGHARKNIPHEEKCCTRFSGWVGRNVLKKKMKNNDQLEKIDLWTHTVHTQH